MPRAGHRAAPSKAESCFRTPRRFATQEDGNPNHFSLRVSKSREDLGGQSATAWLPFGGTEGFIRKTAKNSKAEKTEKTKKQSK